VTLPVIGFAGLTHLGLNMAAASAIRGFRVIGYHDDTSLVAAINAGNLPVNEPGLETAIESHRDKLSFTADVADLTQCDVVYLSVDVPTDEEGVSDLAPIEAMISDFLPHLSKDSVFVVLCQVPPGFTRRLRNSAPCLYYQVETLVFGQALDRALNPERFIVGCATPSADLNPRLQEHLNAFGCPILPMGYESAELAKISINMVLAASISAANSMAEICEHIGADWSEIAPALRLDKRIGAHSYIRAGLGLSGGNLERDLATVIELAEQHRTDAGIIKAWVANSRHRKQWCLEMLKREILNANPDAMITVLGLAYKENTHSTKNSPALALLDGLQPNNVIVHDPLVRPEDVSHIPHFAKDPLQAVTGADAVAIMTPWQDYKNLRAQDLAARMKGRIVIDPYRLLPTNAVIAAGLDHFVLGAPPARA
tara:strand:+ start:9033 stop:10310 length:1278 start_codon:yes stop_codon:yes gene_type:complete